MKTLTSLFRPAVLLAALPAVLAFSACSNDDDDTTTPTPDQGRIMFVHAAAASNVRVKALVRNTEVGQLDYGQPSAYINANTDTDTVRIVVASNNMPAAKRALKVEKDKSYSVFAYSPSATIGSSPLLLTVPDDLTAPPAGQFKVRIVHLAVGVLSPIQLTIPSSLPGTNGTDVSGDVTFGMASSFRNLTAGIINLTITTPGMAQSGLRTEVLKVGDGTGAGTGTKNYEAGKIYTVVVRGIAGSTVPMAQQPQAVIIQNN